MEYYLTGLSTVLGEKKEHYSEVPDFEEKMTNYGLTLSQPFWGWGNYHTTNRSSFELAKDAMKQCLQESGREASEIDVVIFCSAGTGEEYGTVNKKAGELLHSLSFTKAGLIGQNFLGCVSVFSAIQFAKGLLKSEYTNVLIVTADKIASTANRYREFGIYSDSASAFIITNKPESGYRILASNVGTNYQLMSGIMENKDSHFEHLKSVHEKLYPSLNFGTEKAEKVFITNLYKPLLQLNMVRLGYSKEQTYYDNIERTGHCFASDPFVNLQSYRSENENPNSVFVLAAMATGHAGFCVLESHEEEDTLII